jgi:hypothetical protein
MQAEIQQSSGSAEEFLRLWQTSYLLVLRQINNESQVQKIMTGYNVQYFTKKMCQF